MSCFKATLPFINIVYLVETILEGNICLDSIQCFFTAFNITLQFIVLHRTRAIAKLINCTRFSQPRLI